MANDPGMALLNAITDRLWWADIERQRQESDARQEDLDSDPSAAAQDRYETSVIDEARAIVAGKVARAPTVEHLRIALAWLDGALSAPQQTEGESPF